MTSPPEPTAETAIPPFDPEDPSDKQVSGKLQLYLVTVRQVIGELTKLA